MELKHNCYYKVIDLFLKEDGPEIALYQERNGECGFFSCGYAEIQPAGRFQVLEFVAEKEVDAYVY